MSSHDELTDKQRAALDAMAQRLGPSQPDRGRHRSLRAEEDEGRSCQQPPRGSEYPDALRGTRAPTEEETRQFLKRAGWFKNDL